VVTNPGGHSSLPRPDNAIFELAHALIKLQEHQFPFELNSVTRAYYEHMAKVKTEQQAADLQAILQTPPDQAAIDRISKDPTDNSKMHTTCVATRLSGGHANNALPGRAEAIVNCRILPGHSKQEIRDELARIVADPKVQIRYVTNGDHQRGGENVARRSGFSDHGNRGLRRGFHHGCGHAYLRSVWS
jgi:acetylornithine deacetylase/succinyl-diaminopimelate desuccinylase-like protein